MIRHTQNLSSIECIKHGFFTRLGGVSNGIYNSLNCGPGSDDDPACVMQNRTIAAKALGGNIQHFATLYQCHSTHVETVTYDNLDHMSHCQSDAMVTKERDITLGILTADCAPILFVDPIHNIIGAAHAGWRGAANGIIANTVGAMLHLGAHIDHIHAGIGACIGPNSYSVHQDMLDECVGINNDYIKFFETIDDEKYLFNLPELVTYQLQQAGIRHIECLNEDTYADEALYFSYRRNREKSIYQYGRLLSAIRLV